MTDTAGVTITPSTAPGPGGRVSRMTGQIGGAVVLLDLVREFAWLGSGGWNEGQWLAFSAATYWVIGAAHNLWNWWQARNQPKPPPASVEVSAVAAAPPKADRARKRAADDGAVHWPTVAAAVVVVLIVLILI